MEVNRADVLTEVTERFLAYEEAINTNDLKTLDLSFLDSEYTVRFGLSEELWSFREIHAFRRTSNTAGIRRELLRYVITTYGDRFAVANATFTRPLIDKVGRQSQTWVKFGDRWKVVAAHVSLSQRKR